jgi:molybdopterin-biosynthesis enzyme MoeA-like protein
MALSSPKEERARLDAEFRARVALEEQERERQAAQERERQAAALRTAQLAATAVATLTGAAVPSLGAVMPRVAIVKKSARPVYRTFRARVWNGKRYVTKTYRMRVA